MNARSDEFTRELIDPDGSSFFHRVYDGEPPSRVVHERSHFALISDISPLCPGHVLAVPKEFYPSFGAVPAPQWDDLLAFKKEVRRLIRAEFGAVSLFEHGSSSSPAESACVTHAHWQIVPAVISLKGVLAKHGISLQPLATIDEIRTFADRDQPYVFQQDDDDRIRAAPLDGRRLPRQFIRKEFGEHFGVVYPLWDWQVHLDRHALRANVIRLRDAVERAALASS